MCLKGGWVNGWQMNGMHRLMDKWVDGKVDGWPTTAMAEGKRQQGLLKLSMVSVFTCIGFT